MNSSYGNFFKARLFTLSLMKDFIKKILVNFTTLLRKYNLTNFSSHHCIKMTFRQPDSLSAATTFPSFHSLLSLSCRHCGGVSRDPR